LSFEALIGRLQMFLKATKAKEQGRKNKKRRKRTLIFCFQIFEEKTLGLF
jgi:hypothetical protein